MIWFLAASGLVGFTLGMRIGLFGLLTSVLVVAGLAVAGVTLFQIPFSVSLAAIAVFELATFTTMITRGVLTRHLPAPLSVEAQRVPYSEAQAHRQG